MRFIQQQEAPKPQKETAPAPKFGNGGRKDYSALADGKKIPTKGGYK